MNVSLVERSIERVRAFVDAHPTAKLHPQELQAAADAYFARGGKLLRPALCYLCAHALSGGESAALERAIACGAAAEMFHLSTLVHDDVIDRDEVRRGDLSAHALAASLSPISLQWLLPWI